MTHISFFSIQRFCCLIGAALLLVPGVLFAQLRTSTTTSNPASGTSPSLRSGTDGLLTIENSQIRVGINTNAGGAITHLTFLDDHGGKVNTRNMVSNPDLGRQIQIGMYGGPLNYSENGNVAWTGLGWNPIQAGDVYGNPSQVVAVARQENLLYAKTIPKQFAFNNQPGEAAIEHWVRLDGNVVKVHVKVTMARSDKTQYESRQQEFPCVYLTGDYHNMWYYSGKTPFANGDLTLSRIQPPATSMFGDVFPTEPWMASTNDNGYGVGLYVVGNNYEWKRGYFGADLGGDEFSTVASYIAATPRVVLDYNLVHEWDYELILGHLSEIRSRVYSRPKSAPGPNYVFDNSRKGWTLGQAQDTGWPISGKLHVFWDDAVHAKIVSPFVFWKGSDSPKIYLRAAFQTPSTKLRLKWRRSDDQVIYGTGDRYMEFPIKNDGQFHTYELDLSQNHNWLDYTIGQIEFELVADGPTPGAWSEFAWIATSPNGPTPEIPGEQFLVDAPGAAPCEPGCITVDVQKLQFVRSNRKR
ncbi:hypothetical protein [Spirosoma panaciterrae]|uniref:hypothetical protein n=1 Tax=Spirosoma panaciterrae TaxID=496058 RepID=UPI0003722FB2|nr:hypothetical protein [Spirosoma panaciterrae]